MRGRIAAAWSLGWLLACGTSGTFACTDNADCVLGDQGGMCHAGGHCIYPDPACDSGFSYPVGAADVGGECATGVEGTGTGASTSSAEASALASSGAAADTLALDGGTTTSATLGTSTGTTDSSTGSAPNESSSGGGPACKDEVGDDLADALQLRGCAAEVDGTIVDAADADVFVLESCPLQEFSAQLSADSGLVACIFAGCNDPADALVNCTRGQPTNVRGFDGCCGAQDVSALLGCGFFNPSRPIFTVAPDVETEAVCINYKLVFTD